MRIYYSQNAILIEDNPVPFVAGTLTASLNAAAGSIEICRRDSAFVLASPKWDEVQDAAGNGFATPDAAVSYLQSEFSKQRALIAGPRGPGIFTGPGSPDAAFGLTGDLYLDAISGDLFSKET